MPNYIYKCTARECGKRLERTLPISFDPTIAVICDCGGDSRRIIGASSSFVIERETLGKWYRNKTGKDLLGGK